MTQLPYHHRYSSSTRLLHTGQPLPALSTGSGLWKADMHAACWLHTQSDLSQQALRVSAQDTIRNLWQSPNTPPRYDRVRNLLERQYLDADGAQINGRVFSPLPPSPYPHH